MGKRGFGAWERELESGWMQAPVVVEDGKCGGGVWMICLTLLDIRTKLAHRTAGHPTK